DEWARVTPDGAQRQRLLQLAQAADPEPQGFGSQVRQALQRKDRAALRQLAQKAGGEELPPATVRHLARALFDLGDVAQAVPLLRAVPQGPPGDFWINHDLAFYLMFQAPPSWEEALGYYRAAVAIRNDSPGLYLNLGFALAKSGRRAEAVAAYRQAIR